MSKDILIKLRSAGSRLTTFTILDSKGQVLFTDVKKKTLISGLAATVDDDVIFIKLVSTGASCCTQSWRVPILVIDQTTIAQMEFKPLNTANLWRHLTNTTIYNKYYGCIAPYIIEYPFSYMFLEEIVQNVKDYTKAYKYLPSTRGVFDDNRKVQTDNEYFNKAIVYNDQQSSGIINLVPKPVHNLQAYLKYPIFASDSKTTTFTKSDNYYQYNTFWSIVKDKMEPLFTNSCISMSFDKEVNQENMDYSTRSFRKDTIRAKDLKVRHILDNSSNTHLVSQILFAPAMISYK